MTLSWQQKQGKSMPDVIQTNGKRLNKHKQNNVIAQKLCADACKSAVYQPCINILTFSTCQENPKED